MIWDEEVDVACIGAGIGGLATAIAAIDSGGDVIVVPTAARGSDSLRGWWQCDTADGETDEYFAALSVGLVAAGQGSTDVGLAVRVARDLRLDGDPLPPFFGARLPEWTTQCVASPYGVFSSTVFGQVATPMRSVDGETIEVLSVGSIDSYDGLGEKALFDWMAARAQDRDIEISENGQLQRVVFEDGAVIGVVFSTADGPYSVRTRYGLTLSPTAPTTSGLDELTVTGNADRMQVCLVSHAGSRFARVELLAASSDEAVRRPVCTGSGRQLHDDLRHTQRITSEGSRCGRVDRYPPRGK